MVFIITILANQKALATRQRGALGEIRTTRAQQLRNKMIQKNQEAKIPAKRPLTGNFIISRFNEITHMLGRAFSCDCIRKCPKSIFISVIFLFENWSGTFSRNVKLSLVRVLWFSSVGKVGHFLEKNYVTSFNFGVFRKNPNAIMQKSSPTWFLTYLMIFPL